METLIYFLLWAALLAVMLRFGCGAHILGHGQGHAPTQGRTPPGSQGERRWAPPERDRDPVCGMTVETAKAKTSVYDGQVYYFCSSDCRETFEAAPTAYAKPASPAEAAHEPHH